jgi:hypothetical protein
MKLNVRDPKVLLEMVQDRLQATNVCKNDPAVRKFGASLRDWEGQLLEGLRLEGLRISKAEDSADEEIVNAVDRLRFVPDLGDEIFVNPFPLHNWRPYIPAVLRRVWRSLTRREREVAVLCAVEKMEP